MTDTICPECGHDAYNGTCHTCGLVLDEIIYDLDTEGSKTTSFLPAGGLSMDSRSFDYKYRQRIYGGSNAIKLVKRTLHLPDTLCEGAMSRFLKLSAGNNRGTSFSILAGLALILEAQSWDYPLLKREILDILEIDDRKFFYTRRRLGIALKECSANKLAWKYACEKNLSQEIWAEIQKWMARANSKSTRALAGASVFLATRQLETRDNIDSISWWFEASKTSIEKVIKDIGNRYSL